MLCSRLITSNVIPYPVTSGVTCQTSNDKSVTRASTTFWYWTSSRCYEVKERFGFFWKLHKMLVYCPLNKIKVSRNYYCLLTATVRTLYNYQHCKSVRWRIVSQRKIMSHEGGIHCLGETIRRHITLLQGWQLFYYIEYPTQCHNYLVLFKSDNRYQVMTKFSKFSHAVYITIWPSVQWLTARNVKCHVTFFRLIKFKISIWVCNNYSYQINLSGAGC